MSPLPRRIGVLVPSLDPVVEHDLQRYLPPTLSFHVARLIQARDAKPATDESLEGMCAAAPGLAIELAGLEPELILFCCTSGSFFKGVGWDRKLAAQIADACGVPTLTTSTAVLDAFGALGAHRAFMVTPYPAATNVREQKFFGDQGIEIPAFTSFECANSSDIDKITSATILERVLASRADIKGCDSIFVSCTALRAMDTIEALEDALGLPVVTSNAATIWRAHHALGIDPAGVCTGRLFQTPFGQSQSQVA